MERIQQSFFLQQHDPLDIFQPVSELMTLIFRPIVRHVSHALKIHGPIVVRNLELHERLGFCRIKTCASQQTQFDKSWNEETIVFFCCLNEGECVVTHNDGEQL